MLVTLGQAATCPSFFAKFIIKPIRLSSKKAKRFHCRRLSYKNSLNPNRNRKANRNRKPTDSFALIHHKSKPLTARVDGLLIQREMSISDWIPRGACVKAGVMCGLSGRFYHRGVVLQGLVGDSMRFLTFFKKKLGFFQKKPIII